MMGDGQQVKAHLKVGVGYKDEGVRIAAREIRRAHCKSKGGLVRVKEGWY